MSAEDPASGPAPARRWFLEGRRLAEAGRHREAVAAYSRALGENAELAEAYFGRGASLYLLGRYTRAALDLDAASLLGCRDAQFWSLYECGAAEEESGDCA